MPHLTPFAPFFLLLLLTACCGIRGWMLATGASAFIQSAAPIMIAAGGRDSGLIPAYGLMFIGLMHVLLLRLRQQGRVPVSRDASWAPAIWLTAFTLIGVVGAFLLPRLFDGHARVAPPAYGLDRVFVERVHPSGRNLVQSIYLLCNLSLFLICRWVIRAGVVTMQLALRGLAIGACLAAGIGMYQVVAYQCGWPWPSEVINSNTGVGQLYRQTAFGMQRMSASFLEPSLLGFHFLSAFALFGLGLRYRALGALLLLCMLISTSSSAYAGLLLLFPVAVLLLARQSDGRAPLVLAVFAVSVGAAYLADLVWMHGAISNSFLTDKMSSTSGIDRSRTAWLALDTVRDSWGLGVGVGSSRVSGLPMTLASTVGLPGLICLAGFLTRLIGSCLARRDQLGNSFALAIAALIIVWILSIPDLALPYVWILCGLACGLLSLPNSLAAPAAARASIPPDAPAHEELLA
jgi:hypothetical protein